jgi:hypothetical protein
MAYSDYRILLGAKLRDTAGIITPTEGDLLIQEAIRRYSSLRPQVRIQTLTGDGVAITFDLAADFEVGFSTISAIEYPVGRAVPEYLDAEDWTFYQNPDSGETQIRLLGVVLPDTAEAYVTYTLRHVVSEGAGATDTIPIGDREAVCDLAASLGFEQLAAYFGAELEPSLNADLSRGQDRARFYLDMARRRRDAWEGAMGIRRGDVAAASRTGDIDVPLFGPTGPSRFFHGDR